MVGVMPELSVAVGSVQVTGVEVSPTGIVTARESGHPFMTGGVVS